MDKGYKRKSHTSIDLIYYWTATIHNWNPLLSSDANKTIIITYLKKLYDDGLVTIFAFVIMPTHLHLIWRQNRLNGKETPFGSFLKYTGHKFLRELKADGSEEKFKVTASNKEYQIWKRDSLAVEIYSRKAAQQKVDYIHKNPVSGKWRLSQDDIHYYYSSASYYNDGIDNFGFLNDIFLYFDGE